MKEIKCPMCRDEGKVKTGTVHCSYTGLYLYTTYEICHFWKYHPEYLKLSFEPIMRSLDKILPFPEDF